MSAYARANFSGLGLLGIVLLLLAVNGVSVARDCSSMRPVHSGERAPDFSIPKIDESGNVAGEVTLEEYRGKVVVLDFWATWCGPCKASMPVLQSVAETYGEQGVVVVSVNTEGRGRAAAARRMLDERLPAAVLGIDNGIAGRLYKVTTIPHMLVIDRKGTVRFVHRGMGSASGLRSDLDGAIKPLL